MSYPSITLKGIEKAVEGLSYKHGSALKYRLVSVIRGFYGQTGEHLDSAGSIPAEDLIRLLWDVDEDQEALRSKKKNLSSLKSLVNTDLKRLYQEGKNPEGIVIGPENLFTISDEAKDDLLASFRTGAEGSGAAAIAKFKEVEESLREVLVKGFQKLGGRSEEMVSSLDQISALIHALSRKMGLTGAEGMERGGSGVEEKAKSLDSIEPPSGQPDSSLEEPVELVSTEVSEEEEVETPAIRADEEQEDLELSEFVEESLETEEVEAEELEETDDPALGEGLGGGDSAESVEVAGEEDLAAADLSGEVFDLDGIEEAEDLVVEEIPESGEGLEKTGDAGSGDGSEGGLELEGGPEEGIDAVEVEEGPEAEELEAVEAEDLEETDDPALGEGLDGGDSAESVEVAGEEDLAIADSSGEVFDLDGDRRARRSGGGRGCRSERRAGGKRRREKWCRGRRRIRQDRRYAQHGKRVSGGRGRFLGRSIMG
jgi:hypothetical protein